MTSYPLSVANCLPTVKSVYFQYFFIGGWLCGVFFYSYMGKGAYLLLYDRIFIGDMCSGKRMGNTDSDKLCAVCLSALIENGNIV